MNKQSLIKRRTGIDVVDKNGAFNPAEVFEKLINRAAKNPNGIRLFMQEDPDKKIGALGFSEPALKLIAAGFSDYKNHDGKLVQMGHYMDVDGDGSIAADAAVVVQDFTSSMQRLINAFEIFKEKNLAEPVQKAADAFNSLNSDDAQAWLEVGKNIAITTAGMIAARKAFQFGKGAYDFLKPKNKGIPQGVTDSFGSGVIPVYVVNMGTNGMGGAVAGGQGIPGAVGGGASAGVGGASGFWGLTARAIGGAGMVYGMSSLADYGAKSIYEGSGLGDAVRGSSFRDWISESVDSTMLPKKADAGSVWKEVTDWLTSAPPISADPRPWANQQSFQYPFIPQQLQGEIEVTVKDERVQVSKVKINTPGVTMSAQTGISNVHQH